MFCIFFCGFWIIFVLVFVLKCFIFVVVLFFFFIFNDEGMVGSGLFINDWILVFSMLFFVLVWFWSFWKVGNFCLFMLLGLDIVWSCLLLRMMGLNEWCCFCVGGVVKCNEFIFIFFFWFLIKDVNEGGLSGVLFDNLLFMEVWFLLILVFFNFVVVFRFFFLLLEFDLDMFELLVMREVVWCELKVEVIILWFFEWYISDFFVKVGKNFFFLLVWFCVLYCIFDLFLCRGLVIVFFFFKFVL